MATGTQFDEYFDDAFDTLLEEYREDIVFLPGDGLRPRKLSDAIVDRDPPQVWTIAGDEITPLLTIRVHNDSKLGISHEEICEGQHVLVAIKAKGRHSKRTFMRVLNSDGQVTEIAVQ